MKRGTAAWIPRSFMLLAIAFAFLQVSGLLTLPGSEVKIAWFVNCVVYYLFAELLLRVSPVREKYAVWLLAVIAAGAWLNLGKFSAGMIQKGEVSLLNRFEHVLGGLVLFYFLCLLQTHRALGLEFRSRAAELFVVVLCASFLNTIHEILELCLDLWMGFPYTIGPGVFDTNFDLLSSTLGMAVGFVIQLVILRILDGRRRRSAGMV